MTVANWIAVGSLAVAVAALFRLLNKDKAEDIKEGDKTAETLLKLSIKLDQICATTIDIKSDIKAMQQNVSAMDRDIAILKEQVSLITKRVDALEDDNK